MRAAAAGLLLLLIGGTLRAAEPLPRDESNLSLRNEVGEAVEKAIGWLRTHQLPDGSWAGAGNPALTALPLLAVLGNPRPPVDRAAAGELAERGVSFLRKHAQPDGSFLGPSGSLRNTALCLTALAHARQPEDAELLARAATFLTGALSGNNLTLTEMQAVTGALRMAGVSFNSDKSGLDLATRCQFTTGGDAGGFADMPVADRVSAATCSATCAGLLVLLDAGRTRDDPRIAGGLNWLRANFTSEPGAHEARESYYRTLWLWCQTIAALDSQLGADERHNGRDRLRSLALKMVNTQSSDGSWAAPDLRGDHATALVADTSYAALALGSVWSQL